MEEPEETATKLMDKVSTPVVDNTEVMPSSRMLSSVPAIPTTKSIMTGGSQCEKVCSNCQG